MKKPTIEEIQAYIVEKNLNVDAKMFWLKNEERAKEAKDGSTVWMRGGQPMKRWKMCLQIHHEGKWCRTARSDADYRKRNAKSDDRQRIRDDYEDYFKNKSTQVLKDTLTDNGQLAHVAGWLIREILKDRDNE